LLDALLGKLPPANNPNVLVGFDNADDAGVYRIAPDLALVQTVDFFTPMVDDPFVFGQIAAANALSDVYAMGGRPASALSIVAFPEKLPLAILEQILLGGHSKMEEAGCAVIGGHSIADDEMKFGYAVTGLVAPSRVLANSGARPGDALVLTKRLGTGVISTALKRGAATPASIEAAVESMCMLNRVACETMLRYGVHAATDVTGFGLLGHAREVAVASHVRLEIDHSHVQFLPGAVEAAKAGHQPGGLRNNREFVCGAVEMRSPLAPEIEALLYDPQTSGGLLICVEANDAPPLEQALREAGVPVSIVGRVLPEATPPLVVI
jgi:selenide,water dikinase